MFLLVGSKTLYQFGIKRAPCMDVDGADETGDGINLDTKKVLSPEDAATEKQSDNCRKPVAFFETSHH